MERIELRSEKVRNIIGVIPPILIRTGNILIAILFILLVYFSSIIKVPNIVNCEVLADVKGSGNISFRVLSLDKFITNSIEKGTKIKVYKNNHLLYSGKLPSKLSDLELSETEINVKSIIEIDKFKEKMKWSISKNTILRGEIILNDISILNKIFCY